MEHETLNPRKRSWGNLQTKSLKFWHKFVSPWPTWTEQGGQGARITELELIVVGQGECNVEIILFLWTICAILWYYGTIILLLWYYDTIVLLLWYYDTIVLLLRYYDAIVLLLWYYDTIYCYYDTMILWYYGNIVLSLWYYNTMILLLWYSDAMILLMWYYDTLSIILWDYDPRMLW